MSIERIEIQIPQFLKGILIKDLQEHEVICEECEGTGLRVENNPYGLKGEMGLPYKQQTIVSCQHCYNGIRTKCRFCGELISRNYTDKCECEGYRQHKENELEKIEQERFNKANKISYEEYIQKFPEYMIYYENNDKYYSELCELEEECKDEGIEIPKYVYGTYKITVTLDLDDILESACDDLYEDAIDQLAGKDELGQAVDIFNKKNERCTVTYYPDYKIAILL